MAILNNSNAISSGGYDINNSLRFRSSASAYLNRTPATTTNRRTWTWSGWVKRGKLSSSQDVFGTVYTSGGTNDQTYIRLESNDKIGFVIYDTAGGYSALFATTSVYRDPSAWYHIILAFDTTQATSTDRVKLYVNGIQVTSFSSSTYPAQNKDAYVNLSGREIGIGNTQPSGASYFDGYLTEVNFVDGQALTPSSFGETDTTTGSWKPKAYTGTYGTNGFYLKFSDIATTSGSNAGLGKDFSGNANYWTTNNISVTAGTTYDAMTDVPTNTSATVANYPVISPLTGVTPTGGNLNLSGGDVAGLGTMAFPSTGKWYFEMVCGSGVTTTSLDSVGIGTSDINGGLSVPSAKRSVYMYRSNGNKLSIINGGSSSQVAYGATFVNGDVIGVAFDCVADTLTFYKNNTSQGTAFSNILSTTTDTPFFLTVYARGFGGTSNVSLNAGQRPFAYTPPSGFVALNTYNLPDSTIKKGSSYMDATTWTGNGNTTRTITNASSFRPDFVWMKERDIAIDHILYDSIRGPSTSGASKALCSNTTVAEGSQNDNSTYGYLDGFTSSGFTVTRGSDGATSYTNKNNGTYVGWQWQAGQGTTSSNTSGTITSTVSVNTTAGFSIVTYTGNGTAGATVGHGLGVAPKMFIVKNRVQGTYGNWNVWHTTLTGSQYLTLNTTEAAGTNNNRWNGTVPTSTVFSLGADSFGNTNKSGDTYVAYCWAEIAGFSKFGSYTGNGSADGPMIFTGFRPKFIITKMTSGADEWITLDSARSDVANANTNDQVLNPYSSAAESSGSSYGAPLAVDFLSNGFKIRGTQNANNNSGSTFIYMAFAANPFKNSNAF